MVVEEIGPLSEANYTEGGHDLNVIGLDSSASDWIPGVEEGEAARPSTRRTPRRLEINNDSLCSIKCSFYTSDNYFADHSIILEPKETEQICLPENIENTTVQISITNDSFFTPDTDLCIVQMRASYRYQILQSRIYNKEGQDESPLVQQPNTDEDYYSIF
jgi:hypothetical protein